MITFSETNGQTSKGALQNAGISFMIIWGNNVQTRQQGVSKKFGKDDVLKKLGEMSARQN